MAERSAIEWTDATVNFWWGCTKVSPGCDHCYAEALNAFRGNRQWGSGAPRRKIKGALALLSQLNRRPWMDELGRRRRVFMSSMCDLFDNEVDDEWRMEAYYGAHHATNLDIQMLTKRIGNVARMVPPGWREVCWPRHIGLMITITTQAEAERDIPKLIDLKKRFCIPWVGLSCEPLLGPLDLRPWLDEIDWIIVGGESGKYARPMARGWVQDIRDDCELFKVAFFFKQWGEWTPGENVQRRGTLRTADWFGDEWSYGRQTQRQAYECHIDDEPDAYRVGKQKAGRLLDGIEHNAFPEVIG